jgi:ABC-type lipoprotein release transport system permease subunit
MQGFGIVFTLAWRNLWRNYRRTLIMLAAIMVGVWAMIFMTALMRGMVDQMVQDGVRSLPGHVQIHNPLFQDDPTINNLIDVPEAELAVKLDTLDANSWASRIKVPAVISSERESRGVTLFGIDPEREASVSYIAADISEGRYLEGPDDKGVLIGKKLADTLETRVGKRVVLMSQDPDNEIADRGFRVVGIFDNKLESIEETQVFIAKTTAQKFLRVQGHVSEIAILGDNYRDVSVLLADTKLVAGDSLKVEAWYELDAYLGTMLSVMDGFVLVWIVVIFLALSFGLVNTLVMAVFERVREIGLMLALGMRPSLILAQIVIESLLLLSIGLLMGNLLAWVSVTSLESGIDISAVGEGMEMFGAASVLYPQLNVSDMVLASSVVLVLGFVASLSPAWRASRYQPIEAINKA